MLYIVRLNVCVYGQCATKVSTLVPKASVGFMNCMHYQMTVRRSEDLHNNFAYRKNM